MTYADPEKKKAYIKEWRKKNKEKISNQCRKWKKEHPEHMRNYYYLYKYGITYEDRNNMIIEQDGICANPLCDTKFSDLDSTKIHIDHDHDTGKIRGILCNLCNLLEGYVDKNAKRIFGIIEYKRLYNLKG